MHTDTANISFFIFLSSIVLKATSYQLPPHVRTIKNTYNSHSYSKTTFISRHQHDQSTTKLHSSTTINTNTVPKREHSVNGLKCIEITIPLPKIGNVTILEANAASQDTLVNSALGEESNHKLNTDDPYGAVLWPAARTLAQYLLLNCNNGSNQDEDDNNEGKQPSSLSGLTILELGAGTGLVSLAASIAGANVIASDYETIPLTLLQYASKHLNNNATSETNSIQTINFDICDESIKLPHADIIVAADIMYEPKTGKAMAMRAMEALKQNSRIIIADSPGRPGRINFLNELKDSYGINNEFVTYHGLKCSGYRNDLICGKNSTSISSSGNDDDDDDSLENGLDIAIMDLNPNNVC